MRVRAGQVKDAVHEDDDELHHLRARHDRLDEVEANPYASQAVVRIHEEVDKAVNHRPECRVCAVKVHQVVPHC